MAAAARLHLASVQPPEPVRGVEDELAALLTFMLRTRGFTVMRAMVDREVAHAAQRNRADLARQGWIA